MALRVYLLYDIFAEYFVFSCLAGHVCVVDALVKTECTDL